MKDLEYRNIGIMEEWKIGMVEDWKNGMMGLNG
jgi:hypothetical protein